jgi:protocatechuate 3,4-dioxygenase beta subunit
MHQISRTTALPLLLALLAAPAWPEPIRISGRIESSGSAGARVELRPYIDAGGEALASSRPAADGSFVLTAPDSGFYRVLVRAEGAPEVEHPLVPLVEATELPPVRLGAAPERLARFPGWGAVEARTPGAPPSTVRTGRVLDAVTRQPVAGALVWQQLGGTFSWTQSGADGSFRIAAEAARPIAAAAPGYARTVRPEVPPDAPVSISLKPAVVLTGRVEGSEGRPVAGAAVRVVPTDPYPYYRGLRDLVTGFTRADGTFQVRVPARSMLQVGAEAEGFAPAEQVASTGEPGRNPAPLRIVLGPGSSLAGRLVGTDGQPVAGAEVLLRDIAAVDAGLAANPEERRAVTDAAGRFRFEHLAGGVRHLRAGLPGAQPSALPEVEIPDRPGALDLGDLKLRPAPLDAAWTAARVDAGTPRPSDWATATPEPPAAPGQAVTGRLSDPRGNPVAGASLLLHSFETARLLRASTAADGSFEFPQVPDGSYQLVARAEGFADTQAAEVRMAGAPVSGLALRLEPGGSVAGRILGLAEHELPRVQVTAWRDGQETLLPLRALAGTDGRYRITGLPIGEWRITARRTSAYLVEKTVRLTAPGQEINLDLSFPEGVALSGRVLLDGEPLAGAMVALGNDRTEGRQTRQSTTRADGSFAISAVEPGSYKLLVLAGGVQHVQPVEVPQTGELLIELTGGSSR